MRKSFAERNRNAAPLFGSFPRGKPRIRTNDPITPHQTAETEGQTAKKTRSPRKTENRRKPPLRKHVPSRSKQNKRSAHSPPYAAERREPSETTAKKACSPRSKTKQTLRVFTAKRRGTPGTDENNHEKRTFPAVKTEQTLRVFPAKRCETLGTVGNHREEINSPILSARPPFRPLTPSGRNPAPRRMIRTTEQKDVSLFLYPILHEFHSFVNTPRTAILINPLNNPLKKKKIFFSARPRAARHPTKPVRQPF